jgi:eukaryotic-like serine/threonine-protein kinase
MSDTDRNQADESQAGDESLVNVLDQYVEALQGYDADSRSQMLIRHPELGRLLKCLDSLEMLAPREPAEGDKSDADAPTIVSSSDNLEAAAAAVAEAASFRTDAGSAGHVAGGTRFGQYELRKELGRGGMGVVYLARQTELDRVVALKMILSSRLASEEDVRRFHAESKAAARLQHPNIVGIHDAGQQLGQHYFAMDYIDGPNLAEWVRRDNPTIEQRVECLAAVARAADYLHAQGIVHRDLKPSNILVDRSGRPFVTDFGLARVFNSDSRQTQTGTIIGTPSYMPPEQAAGRLAEISPRSDVYSLGAILYELLCGRPPFQRDNPLDVLVEVLEGEPDRPTQVNKKVPRELELVCLKCLEKAPEKRYDSARELADDLDRYLRGESVTAKPANVWQWLRRWGRRQPALVARLGGLLAVAAIVQGRYFYNGWASSHDHDLNYHLRIMAVFGLWAVLSFVFQRLMERNRTENAARFGWELLDAVLLTTALCMADSPLGPLLIGYPLLVAASGLFFRVRLVLFTTAVSLAAFIVLMLLRPEEAHPPQHPLIYGVTLVVIGLVVAHQVHRVRALSRYYDRRSVS